jgi:hypothetical protein
MEPTRKRRWWQFGLRWLFVATLIVAAYAAGRSHHDYQMRRTNDQLRRDLEQAEMVSAEAGRDVLAMKEKYEQQETTNRRLGSELQFLKDRLAAQPDISVFNFSTGFTTGGSTSNGLLCFPPQKISPPPPAGK